MGAVFDTKNNIKRRNRLLMNLTDNCVQKTTCFQKYWNLHEYNKSFSVATLPSSSSIPRQKKLKKLTSNETASTDA